MLFDDEIKEYDSNTLLSDDTLSALIDEKDVIDRQRLILALENRAVALGMKRQFNDLLKAYLLKEKELLAQFEPKKEKRKRDIKENANYKTDFEGPYLSLECGNWQADLSGVRTWGMFGECLACYNPILPIEILSNLETGTEKLKLAFYKNFQWKEITVEKSTIASNTKIVALADLGVPVTTETARYLVRYLSDVESLNEGIIPVKVSTSKMGWFGDEFMPYECAVVFDGEGRFRDSFEAIKPNGNYDLWLKEVKKVRATGRTEPKFFLAASFASPLVNICGLLPFICNLWGETEGGKTVSSKLAVSIWADPREGKYMTDFNSTDTAFEVRLDFLNNLPLIIDDSATVKDKFNFDMSKFIYDTCKGKGRGRSNRSLGVNRENTWQNITLTNGEHAMSNDNLQGGAINRVLDFEVGTKAIYNDPAGLCEVIHANYGYAGEYFIKAVKEIGFDKIRTMQKDFYEQIRAVGDMEKQSASLSVLLTADKIATDYIFCDGEYLKLDEIKPVLVSHESLSENQRCYDYILGEIASNQNKFDEGINNNRTEMWGCYDGNHVAIIKNVFERICKAGGFSSKSFLSWAKKKDLIQCSGERFEKQKRFGGSRAWCVVLLNKQESVSEIETIYDKPPF